MKAQPRWPVAAEAERRYHEIVGGIGMDFGRQEYLDLLASKDPAIKGLIDRGYTFVTNVFRPGMAPKGIRAKTVAEVTAGLQRTGARTVTADAYTETGDPIPTMVSVWKREGGEKQ